MTRWAGLVGALCIALRALAQDAASVDAALASVENLKRRVQTEATEPGQRKAADAMLAARAELVRANADDPRVPVWLADQAEDCFTVALPAGGDVDRTLYGLAGPDARRRVRRLAVEMGAAAEQAEIAAKAVLERAGAEAAPPPLVERLTTVERPRRIPLLRALADVMQVEMAEFDAGRRRSLAESAIARIDTLLPELDRAFRAQPALHWVERFRARGIPVGSVNTLDRALSDPQVLHRQMVLPLADERGHEIRVAGNPIRFADEGHAAHRYPPALGEDGAQVIAEVLGWDRSRIEALFGDGVLRDATRASA